jgi:hypothetical protein
MNDSLFELTVEKNHLSIIIKALSNYMCEQYDGLDAEVVDIPKIENYWKLAYQIFEFISVFVFPSNNQMQ